MVGDRKEWQELAMSEGEVRWRDEGYGSKWKIKETEK